MPSTVTPSNSASTGTSQPRTLSPASAINPARVDAAAAMAAQARSSSRPQPGRSSGAASTGNRRSNRAAARRAASSGGQPERSVRSSAITACASVPSSRAPSGMARRTPGRTPAAWRSTQAKGQPSNRSMLVADSRSRAGTAPTGTRQRRRAGGDDRIQDAVELRLGDARQPAGGDDLCHRVDLHRHGAEQGVGPPLLSSPLPSGLCPGPGGDAPAQRHRRRHRNAVRLGEARGFQPAPPVAFLRRKPAVEIGPVQTACLQPGAATLPRGAPRRLLRRTADTGRLGQGVGEGLRNAGRNGRLRQRQQLHQTVGIQWLPQRREGQRQPVPPPARATARRRRRGEGPAVGTPRPAGWCAARAGSRHRDCPAVRRRANRPPFPPPAIRRRIPAP